MPALNHLVVDAVAINALGTGMMAVRVLLPNDDLVGRITPLPDVDWPGVFYKLTVDERGDTVAVVKVAIECHLRLVHWARVSPVMP
jgi:hypothetical protein